MKSRADRKANLMQMAESEIEQLLDWMEATDAPDLSQIEEEILHLRKRIGEGMTKKVVTYHPKKLPLETCLKI